MRILHITRERNNDSRYGIRKSLLPVVKKLQDRGHYVEIFDWEKSINLPSSNFEDILENLYYKYIENRFDKDSNIVSILIKERLTLVRKAAKYAAKEKITHVHCHDPLLGFYYLIFSKIFRSTQRWGYTIHSYGRAVKQYVGIEIPEHSLKYLQKIEQSALKKAEWIISPSNSGLKKMAEELQIRDIPKKWFVVPHFVSVNLIDKRAAREKIRFSSDEKLVLAVGRLDPMKRFSLLLEAISIIPCSKRPHLIILGEGSEYEYLMKLAEELNILDYFAIEVTDDVGEYLSAADVYVSTSSIESFGLANCEAVVAGVPSICTNVGAVSEILEDAVILVDDNPQNIAEMIVKVLYSKEIRLELEKRAKIVTSKWQDAEAIANKIEKIYQMNN